MDSFEPVLGVIMHKLLIFLFSMLATLSLEAATITNWGAQFPTAAPNGGDVILMQKGGVTYYFTPNQLAANIATNAQAGGIANKIGNLNGVGSNTTFYTAINIGISNSVDVGSYLLPARTNWVNDLVVKETIKLQSTQTNGDWELLPGTITGEGGLIQDVLLFGFNVDNEETNDVNLRLQFETRWKTGGQESTEVYLARHDPDGNDYRPFAVYQNRTTGSNAFVQVHGSFDVFKDGSLTSPGADMLNIDGGSGIATFSTNVVITGATALLRIRANGASQGATLSMDTNDASFYIYNRENGGMFFAVNSVIGMSLSAARNLGIGTVSPSSSIDATGQVRMASAIITNSVSLMANTFAAPASTAFTTSFGAHLWSDGTNLCVVLENSAGTRTTNKLSMTAWP